MRKRLSWRPITRLRSPVRGHDSSAASIKSTSVYWRAANKDDVLKLVGELKADITRGISRSTSRSGTLPQSPLTHSGLLSAQDRHRTPKPPPSKQKLRKNPYAHALATSVRNCFVTGIRLPAHFHVNTGLTPHPETGVPWHLPHDLAGSSDHIGLEFRPDGSTISSTSAKATPLTATSNPPVKPASLSLSGAPIVAQGSCLALVSTMKAREYLGLLPRAWKEGFGIDAKRIVWREDMDTFVLGLLRKKVHEQLIWLVRRSSGYVVRCYGGYDQIADSKQAAAALWLGHVEVTTGLSKAAEGANFNGTTRTEVKPELTGSMEPPCPYAMAKHVGGCVPIYDLKTLLGEENILHLRKSHKIYEGEIVVIKYKNATVDLQTSLWQLMGYLAKSAD